MKTGFDLPVFWMYLQQYFACISKLQQAKLAGKNSRDHLCNILWVINYFDVLGGDGSRLVLPYRINPGFWVPEPDFYLMLPEKKQKSTVFKSHLTLNFILTKIFLVCLGWHAAPSCIFRKSQWVCNQTPILLFKGFLITHCPLSQEGMKCQLM